MLLVMSLRNGRSWFKGIWRTQKTLAGERDDLSRSSNRRYFRQWRQRMGIKIGKIQTREYMSRLEMPDKFLVLCFKAEPLFSTIFNIERIGESVHVSLPPRE